MLSVFVGGVNQQVILFVDEGLLGELVGGLPSGFHGLPRSIQGGAAKAIPSIFDPIHTR